ncbi:hypothetical protein XU18_1056 [Perkinsela sp. CCAP 1560/4]|nr:hypothetical protein XU18_1056 [Perkinsela sp. CCAP 1560/4]|eukprot:KNH08487.1 hypothetical protein XU18_1056 [Perkinsela sp. CCAP 1560/4]
MSTSSLASTDLALSKRLRVLCEDYENRPYVVKRGVLETILKFLSHENLIVATNAVEALLSLSEHPDNPTPMCREKALLPALSAAYQSYSAMATKLSPTTEEFNSHSTDEQDAEDTTSTGFVDLSSPPTCAYLAEIITKIVSNLEKSLEEITESEFADEDQVVYENNMNLQGDDSHSRITSSVIHQRRNVVLDIPSLAEENVNQLAKILENVDGIISFTIDFNRHIVRLLLTTPTPTFLRILDNHGFISIILQEENVQSNLFHRITDEHSLHHTTSDHTNRRHKKKHSSLIPHDKLRHKAKHCCQKAELSIQIFLGYINNWINFMRAYAVSLRALY